MSVDDNVTVSQMETLIRDEALEEAAKALEDASQYEIEELGAWTIVRDLKSKPSVLPADLRDDYPLAEASFQTVSPIAADYLEGRDK